jgi:hypothetical protein
MQQILQAQNRNIANMNRDIFKLGNKIKEVQTEAHANSLYCQHLTDNIKASDNNFSIDNVNTITKEYINCVNKLNFTTNLINEKKGEILGAGEYASVLRPIFENKYTDNAVIINGYIVVASAEPIKMIHFFEPDSNWDNKQNNIWNVYREKCETDGYNRFNELRSKSPKKTQFYVLIPYDWELGVKIAFFLYTPDILDKTGKEWIKIVSGFNLTPSITKYAEISDLPASYISYLGKIEDAFNTFSSNNTDYKLGTIYQLGPDNKFNTLKIVSSQEYPSWEGQYIANSYIPGSNINMPNIILQINTELNRSYTGMQEGQIVIVEYVVGSVYYTGVIKMILVDGYDGLCYQIQSININDLFETSVQMTGDVGIQGNLNVTRYNGDAVISTDNTRKVTTFHDKVGINQRSHEVSGLLDIDNLTQQVVFDLFETFVPHSVNSYDIMRVIIKKIANKSEKQPYTKLSQFPVGKTDNVKYNSSSNNMDFYMPNHQTKDLEAILYVHGGSFVSGNEEDKDAVNAMARFNADGYIACSMAYSLQQPPTGGFTQEWWNKAVINATNDLIDAIEYIQSLGATGIHIMGYSAGAIMVLMTALNDKHPFIKFLKKIPPNFILTRTSIGGSLITPDGFSIVKYLDTNCPPLLLWNGSADKTVDKKGALAIKQRYTDLGKSEECRLYLLDGSTHSSILIDKYNGKNVLDVSIAFVGQSLFTTIPELFADGNPLFDYSDQCTVFSVPIKPIIHPSDVKIIHEDGVIVDLRNGVGNAILSAGYTFERLQQCVKEINQMEPEIIAAADPEFIFSFIELLCDIDKNWYVVSMRARIDNNLTSGKNEMVFVMTYLNVTNIMRDNSTGKVLLDIINYISREVRFINYVCLLFKNKSNVTAGGFYDSNGNLSLDSNGNIRLQQSIKNNEYFSNRFDLLPESYIFAFNVSKGGEYLLHEANPHWNGKMPIDLWSNDVNVSTAYDTIRTQEDVLYNNPINSTSFVTYLWNSFRKISFVNTITVSNGTKYLIGSGLNLKSILNQSLIITGDNTINGNLFVNDSNNNNIFKVDNVAKTITNSYKVGIGTDEPRSMLDINDTTIQDVLNEVDAAIKQYKVMNSLVKKLRTASSDKEFGDIVRSEPNLIQTNDSFYAIWKFAQGADILLSSKMSIIYHWLYPDWQGNQLGEINDPVKSVPLQTCINVLQEILDNEILYDGHLFGLCFSFVFGIRLIRCFCFTNNGNLYFLGAGTNLQHYGIRYNSNNNLSRLYDLRVLTGKMLSEIDRRIRNQSGKLLSADVRNLDQGLNTLRSIQKKYSDIQLATFELVIDLNNIHDVMFSSINVDLTTPNDISLGTAIKYADFDYNLKVKCNNIFINLTTKYNIQNANNASNTNQINGNDYFILYYEDLTFDYISGIKCMGVSGSKVTLVVTELCVQDCVYPTLNVSGDAKIIGDLVLTDQTNNTNYVSIDPAQQFFGVNTDERFINYQDIACTTCTNIYSSKHNVYVKRDSYPVMVCERVREDDAIPVNLSSFGTYSAFTVKRKSNLYDFSEIGKYANQLDTEFLKTRQGMGQVDNVTHMRYGPDISFEVCDKTNRSVELGQVQLTIDGIDPTTGYLQCGFGVQVNDFKKGALFENVRRNLMYVDNSSRLFVKEVSLNGRILSTDKNGKLLIDNKIVQLFPVEDAVVFHLTSTDNYIRLFNNIDNYIELRPVQIKVVLDSNGVNLMTNNFVKDKNIETQITSYLDKGVVFEVCEKTMSKKNMTKDEFIKGSTFIKFAIQRYVELCRDGFIGVEQQ